ncbi:MAG: hypothetical protein OEQ81_01645 [Flavobacteriaceae bacterium]|nr:hypothetical protein [Flavobacteriaceae bacterium]
MKKDLIRIALVIFAFFMAFSGLAQGLYQKGKIQISKKKHIDAYIQIDYRFPQRFQEDITYLEPDSYAKWQETGKLKGKHKIKLGLKDFEGFALDNGQSFKVIKYIDLTKKGIGMLPKRICVEQIANGKVDAYKLYSNTTGKISYELADVVMDSKMQGDQMLIDYIQDNFQILVQKLPGHKNPRNLQGANLLTLIGDNERVKTNYDNNHYGFRNQFTERQKFGVIVNKQYESSFLKMINDYNGIAVASLEVE